MRILFFSPGHRGHYLAYLGRMLPAFLELPVEIVVATTPEAVQSIEYSKSLKAFEDDLEIVTCCTEGPSISILEPGCRLRELTQAIRLTKPDHVAVCMVDGIWDRAYVATLLGRRPWPRELTVEGWLYRARFGDRNDRRLRSGLRRWMFPRLLRSGLFRKLHLDHELLYDFAVPLAAGTPTEVVLTPNPIALFPPMSKEDARRRLDLPTGGRWLSLSGMIAQYKGAHLLLDAYRRYRNANSDSNVRLLLAGPHKEPIHKMLCEEPYQQWIADGSIVSIDRFLDEEEMYAAAAAADVVMAPYPRHHGRSSIILWAAAAGRPSLGAEDSNIGHVIRQQQLGRTCNVQDTSVLAEAIAAMLETPWDEVDAHRVRSYAEFHRIENYQRTASALVRQRLETRPLID